MKEIIGSFMTINTEKLEELESLFKDNGYELAVRTEQGKISEIYILSELKEQERDTE